MQPRLELHEHNISAGNHRERHGNGPKLARGLNFTTDMTMIPRLLQDTCKWR